MKVQVYTYPKSNEYNLYNTFEHPVIGLKMFGKSVQDSTPTTEAPVDVVSIGDDGAVIVTVDNSNDITLSATITSGLPLCSVGSICDELIYNADGTGKIIKYFEKQLLTGDNIEKIYGTENSVGFYRANIIPNKTIKFYGTDKKINAICTHYPISTANSMSLASNSNRVEFAIAATSTTRFIVGVQGQTIEEYRNFVNQNEIYIVYELETPYEVTLSASEMSELMALHTFDGVTNVYNDKNTEMQITFLGGNEMQTNIDGFWDSDDGDKKYSAADFVGFFQDFFTNGIVAESTTYLQVMAKSNFNVAVNVGKAYINGCFFKPKTITTLALDVNDGTADRTDLIVIRWDKPLRQIYLAVKKGTTQLTRNELVYELGIAKIVVKSGATQITQANISDVRFDNAYCGVVTGVIDTINTTQLFAQYEAEWENFVAQLGESDNVTINVADKQAREDIATINENFADLLTKVIISTQKSGLKVLTGSVTGTGKRVSFSESFTSEPKIAISITPASVSSGYIYSGYISSVSTSGFTVNGQKSDGSVISDQSCSFKWIAIGI